MRLTLRTLLAYLDDVLEPAQTKEIGQKIQESPMAAALVSRVREVIRRRRLAAPEVDGGRLGVDPNLVAQYLDNTLREEHVADIERVCLESDLQLAEVAACHQILTLVLGEPVELPEARLDRFYALGPMSTVATAQGSPQPTPRSADVPMSAASTSRSFHEGLPEYLKPTPWPQRVAPGVGIAVVLIGAVLALALDPELVRTLVGIRATTGGVETNVAQTSPSGQAADSSQSKVTESPAAAADSPQQVASSTGVAMNAGQSGERVAMPTLPADIDPAPPADVPEPTAGVAMPPSAPGASPLPAAPVPTNGVTSPSPTPPPQGAGTAVTAAATPAAGAPAAAMTTKPATPQPVEPLPAPIERIFVPMHYTSTEGVLLRYQRADAHWYVEPRRAQLHPEEIFACPEPFEGTLDLDDGQLSVTLLGGAVIQILPATPAHRIRLELQRGRLLLHPGLSAVGGQVRLQVVAGDREWELSLSSPTTQAGLERTIFNPAGLPFPKAPEWWALAVLVPAGEVQVIAADGVAAQVGAGQLATLQGPQGAGIAPMFPTPEWLDPDRRNSSSILRRYGVLFEREFAPEVAIDLSIPALARDPRPKIAELATRCLGITESAVELMNALVRSEHAESRLAAAEGLRSWLIQEPARADQLNQIVQQHYPDSEAQALFTLLVGLSPEDARNKATSYQVVEWLRSNFVEVRELAIEQLEKYAGRRYDYRPLGSPSQREPGIQRWLGHLDREGAIVGSEQN